MVSRHVKIKKKKTISVDLKKLIALKIFVLIFWLILKLTNNMAKFLGKISNKISVKTYESFKHG